MFDDDGDAENTTIGDQVESIFDDSDSPGLDEDDEICDCHPDYKEVVPLQKLKGASIGAIGGQMGGGSAVVVCKNCNGRFEKKEGNNEASGWGDFHL